MYDSDCCTKKLNMKRNVYSSKSKLFTIHNEDKCQHFYFDTAKYDNQATQWLNLRLDIQSFYFLG